MIQLEREYDAYSEFNTLQNMHIEVQMRNDLYNTQRKESTNLKSSNFSIYSHMLYYRQFKNRQIGGGIIDLTTSSSSTELLNFLLETTLWGKIRIAYLPHPEPPLSLWHPTPNLTYNRSNHPLDISITPYHTNVIKHYCQQPENSIIAYRNNRPNITLTNTDLQNLISYGQPMNDEVTRRVSQNLFQAEGCSGTCSNCKGVPDFVLAGRVSQNLFQLEGCPETCSYWKGVPELVTTGSVSQNLFWPEGYPRTCSD